MNPDLVRSSRLNLHVEQSEPVKPTPHAVERKRWAATAHDSHARAVARVARNRLVNRPALLRDVTVNERDVYLENFAGAKLVCQFFMRAFCCGDHHETGRIAV